MKILSESLNGILVFEHKLYKDSRGFFYESFNDELFKKALGSRVNFIQDNHSSSKAGVIRGLHYQVDPHAQGKLVRVISGSVIDVAVDLRRSSPSFGMYFKQELSEYNKLSMWIPEGFAHGFLSLQDNTQFLYKTTNKYSPEDERTIKYNDRTLNINWGDSIDIIQSESDIEGAEFENADYFN